MIALCVNGSGPVCHPAGQHLAPMWNMGMNGESPPSVTVETVASIVTLALNNSFTQRWGNVSEMKLKRGQVPFTFVVWFYIWSSWLSWHCLSMACALCFSLQDLQIYKMQWHATNWILSQRTVLCICSCRKWVSHISYIQVLFGWRSDVLLIMFYIRAIM